jgi:hypothetical protein
MINNADNIDDFIKNETSLHTETLWGQPCTVEPVLIDEIVGDGLQVIYWGTIDQRPQYWVLRIDSKTDIEADDFNQQDELYFMVSNQFGTWDREDCEIDEAEYPMVIDTMGSFWGVLKNFGEQVINE